MSNLQGVCPHYREGDYSLICNDCLARRQALWNNMPPQVTSHTGALFSSKDERATHEYITQQQGGEIEQMNYDDPLMWQPSREQILASYPYPTDLTVENTPESLEANQLWSDAVEPTDARGYRFQATQYSDSREAYQPSTSQSLPALYPALYQRSSPALPNDVVPSTVSRDHGSGSYTPPLRTTVVPPTATSSTEVWFANSPQSQTKESSENNRRKEGEVRHKTQR